MQFKPKFIEASNGFIRVKPVSVQKTSYNNRTEATSTGKEAFVKVSKRFDVSNQFTIVPAFIICYTVNNTAYTKGLYRNTVVKNNYHRQRLLRGPPCFRII